VKFIRTRHARRYSFVTLASGTPALSASHAPLSPGVEFESVRLTLTTVDTERTTERLSVELTAEDFARLAAFVDVIRDRANSNAATRCTVERA
jgi:pterin-4a-carbinolamine dehydratase